MRNVTEVNNKISEFEKNNIKDGMSTREKIKAFHDYLINNSVYDKERADLIEKGQDSGEGYSHKATGPPTSWYSFVQWVQRCDEDLFGQIRCS